MNSSIPGYGTHDKESSGIHKPSDPNNSTRSLATMVDGPLPPEKLAKPNPSSAGSNVLSIVTGIIVGEGVAVGTGLGSKVGEGVGAIVGSGVKVGKGTGIEVGIGVEGAKGVGVLFGLSVEVGVGPVGVYMASGVKVGRTGGMYLGVPVGKPLVDVGTGVEKVTLAFRLSDERSNLVGVGSIELEHPNPIRNNMLETKTIGNFIDYSSFFSSYL